MMATQLMDRSGEPFHDLLGESLAIGATAGAFLENLHHLAHVGPAAGSGFGDRGVDEGAEFFCGKGGGEVGVEDLDLGFLDIGEFGSPSLFELLDGVLALFDLFSDNVGFLGVIKLGICPALGDGGVLDGALQGPQGVQGLLVLGSHGRFEVFGDLCADCSHGWESRWCDAWGEGETHQDLRRAMDAGKGGLQCGSPGQFT